MTRGTDLVELQGEGRDNRPETMANPDPRAVDSSAAGVSASTAPFHGAGPDSIPRAALHDIVIRPVPFAIARALIVPHHYLHSLPGGTMLAFGVFLAGRLLGAVTFGVGPFNGASLVTGAACDDCLTLTRFWLSDELPGNSESRVLGLVIKALKRHTTLRFLIAYADPSMGHVGTIYQASNWQYSGLSEATSQYDVGDGRARHGRSLAHSFGTCSVRHPWTNGVPIRLIPQARKHRYIYFLDPAWRSRLHVQVQPYPKREAAHGRS